MASWLVLSYLMESILHKIYCVKFSTSSDWLWYIKKINKMSIFVIVESKSGIKVRISAGLKPLFFSHIINNYNKSAWIGGIKGEWFETDLEERITDSCHIVLWRVTRNDQALHDLNQIWDCLRYTNTNTHTQIHYTWTTETESVDKQNLSDQEVFVCLFVCPSHTFLKRSRVSGFFSHSSVMSTTAPCNTPAATRRQIHQGSMDIGVSETGYWQW